jgi:predicted ATPase
MYISRLILKNWRNFRQTDISLQLRMFLVGPNASGKSNILDAIRFLRDLCKTGGGLQSAVNSRGGLSKIRSLFARDPSDVIIGVELSDEIHDAPRWKYEIALTQSGGGVKKIIPVIRYEKVWKTGKQLFQRPDDADEKDPRLLNYTRIEQPTANKDFRDIADFLSEVRYLHIVPQLVRNARGIVMPEAQEDSFGKDFIDHIAKLNKSTVRSYLARIGKVLRTAVPQFGELELITDEAGTPHLQTLFKHWRPKGAKQWEDQFSDGTLRLIGFVWSLMEGTAPLLLEEPELSLHPAIVANLSQVIALLQRKPRTGSRQVIATTHSSDLLADRGISGDEVAALIPEVEGTTIKVAIGIPAVKNLLESGFSVAESVIPMTAPKNPTQLLLDL